MNNRIVKLSEEYGHCVSRLSACHHDLLGPNVLSKMRRDSCPKCNPPDILQKGKFFLSFLHKNVHKTSP